MSTTADSLSNQCSLCSNSAFYNWDAPDKYQPCFRDVPKHCHNTAAAVVWIKFAKCAFLIFECPEPYYVNFSKFAFDLTD